MPSTITAQSANWDSQYGSFVLTTTAEAFDTYPQVPSDALDATKSYQDGKYVVTYREIQGAGSSSGTSYSYEMHGTLSTEPLKTHPYFAAGGKYALSTDDLEKIKLAEADATLWKKYIAAGAGGTSGLYVYSAYFGVFGIDSYLVPSLTMSITTTEGGLPNLTKLGKVDVPINAPQLSGNANWLLSGCTASSQPNGGWKITREYRSSGPLGWNQYLYT